MAAGFAPIHANFGESIGSIFPGRMVVGYLPFNDFKAIVDQAAAR